MNRDEISEELQLIRAMTVLATEAIEGIEDSQDISRVPEARILLRHVEQRQIDVEEALERLDRPQLKVVAP